MDGARTEDLRKALEEAALAREAAAVAEKQRLAAVKAAEQATKAAELVIAQQQGAVGELKQSCSLAQAYDRALAGRAVRRPLGSDASGA